jgi:hypothetical protein
MPKTVLKTIRGQLLAIPKYQISRIDLRFFLKFCIDYDLNLGRYLNPNLPPIRDFASLILGKYCTFVCGTLFGGIDLKLNEPYLP